MMHPLQANEDEVLEVTDAEEAVFEALLPAYLAGSLNIEKVRQVSRSVARLLENFKEALNDAEAGRVYSEEEFYRMLADDE
jgi:hypothetical protein